MVDNCGQIKVLVPLSINTSHYRSRAVPFQSSDWRVLSPVPSLAYTLHVRSRERATQGYVSSSSSTRSCHCNGDRVASCGVIGGTARAVVNTSERASLTTTMFTCTNSQLVVLKRPCRCCCVLWTCGCDVAYEFVAWTTTKKIQTGVCMVAAQLLQRDGGEYFCACLNLGVWWRRPFNNSRQSA